ncbi:hypothetical protein [Sphingomonas xinjiangensis]|uniref:Uncharacterized protein n=1 Tax=Sphingomonas xinjiangensis TaxID=643568 RepID=A0A840YSH6_9SPHN|nr:hypothetical protein [Sphingomonas xinjiangensis]MBB5712628.1 hypothetical protein [Sphingomonas xinjiangensis]
MFEQICGGTDFVRSSNVAFRPASFEFVTPVNQLGRQPNHLLTFARTALQI